MKTGASALKRLTRTTIAGALERRARIIDHDHLSPMRDKIRAAVGTWLSRSHPSEATLTLDGTGPNGALQLPVLLEIGFDRLYQLKEIHVLSGSFFSFIGAVSFAQGEHVLGRVLRRTLEQLIEGWDRTHRETHRVSVGRLLWYVLFDLARRRPLFPRSTLSRLLLRVCSASYAERTVAELPCNAVFWLYDQQARELVRIARGTPMQDVKLIDIAQCAPAVPGLYEPGLIMGRRFIDPIYSPDYRKLLRSLREGARNHLLSNVMKERVTEREITLKMHEFGDGRKMMAGDFVRSVLNLKNRRIGDAYRAALGLVSDRIA
jgi:hypothetical protein